MVSPRRWLPGSLVLLVTVLLVSACTRDRITPPATEDAGSTGEVAIAEPVVTRVDVTPTPVSPTAEPTPTETPEPETIPYTVQPGDSVSTIAEKFGVTSQTIREINLLATDALQVGQVLRVPNSEGVTGEGIPTATAAPFRYTVVPGDTLLSIALAFDVAANDIVAANTLANPNSLTVGSELLIPGYQPTTSQTGANATSGYQYTVQTGDTLGGIAQQFGVPMAEIVAANDLANPNSLLVGTTLVIPGGSAPPAASGTRPSGTGPAVHEVQAGEYLSSIAERYGVTMRALIDANEIPDPNLVVPGTRLIIPGITPDQAETLNQTVHTVVSGDTLNAIAARYGVSTQALIDANNILDPSFLRLGDELVIPTSP